MRGFVLWLLDRLSIPCVEEADDLYRLALPASQREHFENRPEVLFTFDAQRYDGAAKNDLEFAAPGHRLFRWLFEQSLSANVLHKMAPPQQPEHVSEISQRLFSAYTIDGGSVHLAGCTLEDRWVVRFVRSSANDANAELVIGPDGRELASELRHELGMDQLAEVATPDVAMDNVPAQNGKSEFGATPRSVSPQQLARIAEQIQLGIRRLVGPANEGAPGKEGSAQGHHDNDSITAIRDALQDIAEVQLIRTRWVSGKLRFTYRRQTVDAAFAGWARSLTAPEVECPRTGKLTRHLSTTDDERLAAAESIETCEKTGQRVLQGELKQCSISGTRCLPEYLGHCAVTNLPVMRETLVECPHCRQQISPASLSGAKCYGCRKLASVSKNDARLSLILTEYPKLDEWRRWRLSETEVNFIVTARRGFQRLMVVIEKETMQVGFLARAGWRPRWTAVESVEEQAEILGAWS
mgnify:FL=1